MTDARNVYPRLCWGCLGVIEDVEQDNALFNYGGYCDACTSGARGEMPGLRDAMRGYTERMNDVSEREELLREVGMSEKEELATGGVIEPALQIFGNDPGPEIVFLPRNAQVYPNPTLCNPGGPAFTGYVGDVPWQYTPPPAPWQPVQIQFVPSNAFPTPESLREFVEQRVSAYLDEKLDERVSKALDELAREMHDKALQPGTWRKDGGNG